MTPLTFSDVIAGLFLCAVVFLAAVLVCGLATWLANLIFGPSDILGPRKGGRE